MTSLKEELRELVRRLGKRPPITLNLDTGHMPSIAGSLRIRAAPPSADAPLEEKVEWLTRQVDAVSNTAANAAEQASETKQRLERTTARLDEELSALRSHVATKLRDQSLHGLPLAVFGLVLIGVGALWQLASAFL